MNLTAILALLIGGGGIGSLVSAFLTRKTEKDKIEISLLDRAYEEINRLNEVTADLRSQLEESEGKNKQLKLTVEKLEKSIRILESEIRRMEEQREGRRF